MSTTHGHHSSPDSLPRALISPSRWSWVIWLIPVGAVLLCVWFIFRDYVATGPYITLNFPDASGLEVKNTPLRFLGVQVGQVASIKVSPDRHTAQVGVRMAGGTRDLTRAGSLFWIVRPELNVSSISGLGTIVSGEYIAVQPGNGPFTNKFAGIEKEPVPEAPGALLVKLTAPAASSLQEQSPVYYRGIRVGEVLGVQLAPDSRTVEIQARIWHDFAPLVRPETEFWNAGGLEMQLGLFHGLRLNAVSPGAILSGGIEFATPPDAGSPVTNNAVFVLNEKADEKWKAWNPVIPLNLTGSVPDTNVPSSSIFNRQKH
jgi:paraquat-inducible protein B